LAAQARQLPAPATTLAHTTYCLQLRLLTVVSARICEASAMRDKRCACAVSVASVRRIIDMQWMYEAR